MAERGGGRGNHGDAAVMQQHVKRTQIDVHTGYTIM